MSDLKFVGGPKDGETYPLDAGQSPPTEYRHTGWSGHYVYRDGRFVWRSR